MAVNIESFRDRDFLSTDEGFLFCVIGPYHPVDRIISYLKYIPSLEGNWIRENRRFKRVMRAYTISNLIETINLLKNKFPKYLFFSQIYDISMTAVPHEDIKEHFQPDKKLAELSKRSQVDPLQNKVLQIVSLLSELSDISVKDFGVTGSILLEIHNPLFSDMDITVYGRESCHAVKNALACELMNGNLGNGPIKRVNLKAWCRSKSLNHPISFGEAEKIYRRKWNIGVFNDTSFSIHPVKTENELTEKYGDLTFQQGGNVTIKATVVENKDSIFLPATYKVKEVEFEGEENSIIEEVVCYEALYDSLAEINERIIVKGKLEHVIDKRSGRKYDRVLVGSLHGKGAEYIKPLD